MIRILTPDRVRGSLDFRSSNCVLRYSSELAGAGPNDMMLRPYNGWGYPHSVLWIHQQQVFSRGNLTLQSRDPGVDPRIELGLLTEDRDLVRMRDALDRATELLSAPAFATIIESPPELPEKQDLPRVVMDSMHISGTCPMGSPDDGGTVVDPDCRVLGIDGLRVIDASVIPEIPRANLHLTVVMIAELMASRLSCARAGESP